MCRSNVSNTKIRKDSGGRAMETNSDDGEKRVNFEHVVLDKFGVMQWRCSKLHMRA